MTTPYTRAAIPEQEHAWYCTIAEHGATVSAQALAKGCMRLGHAHRYLLAAHLGALMDGMGEDRALEVLGEIVADLIAGTKAVVAKG